MNSNVR